MFINKLTLSVKKILRGNSTDINYTILISILLIRLASTMYSLLRTVLKSISIGFSTVSILKFES